MDVTGKVALVTGGGRGIGRSICHALARHGAHVAAGDINEEGARRVSAEVAEYAPHSLAIRLDVTDVHSVEAAVERIVDEFGVIDIAVNNAGTIGAPGWEGRDRPNDSDWESVYAVNVRGIANVTEAVARRMIPRRSGKIVNIASVAGRVGTRTNFAYGSSKAAAINLTRCYAVEYAPHNINVNCVCPGLVWTNMWERIATRRIGLGIDAASSTRESFERYVGENTPLGREQTPEEIANAVAFLASDAASGVTGQSLNVDGGYSMD